MRHADEVPAVANGPSRPRATRGREGFFRVTQDNGGRWWLSDPEGTSFYLRGVHGVRTSSRHGLDEFSASAVHGLREWGFNALGLSDEQSPEDGGLPFLASAEFCSVGRVIVAPGVHLPDVFDPDWPAATAEWARKICAAHAEARTLIGWVTDDRLQWANPSVAGRPSLLQLCLSLEPGFAAYHAAWEFVLAHHGGRLDHVAQAWNARLPNKEVVRELTRAEEGLGTRGYLRDDARWAREFARRYFTTTGAAIRQADPNHLVLGCRFHRAAGNAVLAECVYPAIDVSMPHWTELPVVNAHASQPVVADNVNWVTEGFMRLAAGRRTRRLTTFEHVLRKARATLDRAARHPAVVGYVWAQWEDEPGEQPPFAGGLVHVNGVEAREHTELLAQFNLRAEHLHRTGTAAS